MEKIFYHPTKFKGENIPVFSSYYQYKTIYYFLQLSEELEPSLIEDLKKIASLYAKIEDNVEDSIFDEWVKLEQAHLTNTDAIELRHALIKWANKYNLYDNTNKTYLEIALWALSTIIDHSKNIEERKELLKKLGRDPLEIDEAWTITDCIYFETEYDQLIETDKIVSFDELFPFVFTPNYTAVKQRPLPGFEITDSDYEGIFLNYFNDIYAALKNEKKEITGFTCGYSWDPRSETWNEYEKGLNIAFEQYKNLYRVRSENYLKSKGFVEGKAKRNKDHFLWFVRYQIQKWEISDIADFYSKKDKVLSDDTIKKALKDTSQILGLKLRK